MIQNKTVILFAHRLSTVVHLDRIIVFEESRVIEDGSHVELLERRGQYFRLWSRQSQDVFDEETADA